ncbi:MAG: DNA polymerase III subunit gamma/tau [Pseudomonadota bacterium]
MTDAAAYRVLARKYRPQVFADLFGQEAMVRTLTNAFAAERIAHAFVLTGVRGVGKTTTARIIARGLNCEGPDGQGGITVTPCGVCGPCKSIADGRHVDVLEMDAATHTQVDRMRELLASVPYRPAESRMKVYIIDEVHMLSTASFNALLKTLEEPPAHVTFIFATTEIRKVPVTVLSRCQRFDLRRIEPEVMMGFLAGIADKEGAAIDADALALITRAAEGSARDALSLLDQAIAHGGGKADREAVRLMLGLADRGRVLDLFDLIMRGEVAGALGELSAQYAAGADPIAVLRDLAEITHWISVVKVAPSAAEDPLIAPEERRRGMEMAERLSVPTLARTWQMLLKALEEVASAPNAMMAAEMAVIRLTHVADLPPPAELVRRLTETTQAAPRAPRALPGSDAAQGSGAGQRVAQGAEAGTGPASVRRAAATTTGRDGPALVASDAPHLAGEEPPPSMAPPADLQKPATPAPLQRPPSAISAIGPAPASSGMPPGQPAARAADPHAASRAEPLDAEPLDAKPLDAESLDVAALAPPDRADMPASFEAAVALIRKARDLRLLLTLERHVRLVSYTPGWIAFQPTPDAPTSLAGDLAQRLETLTGQRWTVVVAATGGGATLAETRETEAQDLRSRVAAHPLVAAALEAFPGAEIREIRPRGQSAAIEPALEELAAPQYGNAEDMPDDWDPFDSLGEEE